MITLAISITLTILFFLAIWATDPIPENYIKRLWNDLSYKERKHFKELQKRYAEIKLNRDDIVEYFILAPDGEVFQTDLVTSIIHEKINPQANRIAYTKVNQKEIVTELVKCSMIGISFETTVINNGEEITSIRDADNLLNARLQHLKAIESLAL